MDVVEEWFLSLRNKRELCRIEAQKAAVKMDEEYRLRVMEETRVYNENIEVPMRKCVEQRIQLQRLQQENKDLRSKLADLENEVNYNNITLL